MIHDLIDDTTLSIVEKFGKKAIRRSIMSLRCGDAILKDVIKRVPSRRRCVEIGTFLGVTTAYLAKWFDEVVTIDLKSGQKEEVQKIYYDGASRNDIWKYLECDDKIKLFLIKNESDKWHIFNNLDFDFAFLDGGDENMQTDFNYVKRCGNVLFHDVCDRRPAILRVVKSLPQGSVRYYSNDNTDADIFAHWIKP